MGVDADTGRILASAPTGREVDDGARVAPLLDRVAGSVASFVGDGAYDREGVYASVAERWPEAAVVVPPRSTTAPGDTAETAPAHLRSVCGAAVGGADRGQRDRHPGASPSRGA